MKCLFFAVVLIISGLVHAQSADIFLMPGSDFSRPGSVPRVNLNVGIGVVLDSLAKSPVGNEVTFSYTYENAASHGFWHTNQGAHTEAFGMMRNFAFSRANTTPYTHRVTGYLWNEIGVTSFTGPRVQNRLYESQSIGVAVHSHLQHHTIWIQEQYNKIATAPWYTTTSIGYVYSR